MTYRSSKSPWASHTDKQSITLKSFNARPNSEVFIPGSKSFSNRALILSACAHGRSLITGLLKSDDTYWCIEALKNLGIEIGELKEGQFEIFGTAGKFSNPKDPIFIGAGGTIARFLPGVIAASTSEANFVLEADRSLSSRPISPLVSSLRKIGAEISYLGNTETLPISIKAQGLKGGEILLPGNVSSQYLSGLLMSAPLAKDNTTIKMTSEIVQPLYVSMTVSTMESFGVQVQVSDDLSCYRVAPSSYQPCDYTIEADVSSAGYMFALAAITNQTITVKNINPTTLQPDLKLLEILERMGCHITRNPNSVTITGPSALKGGFTVSLKDFSDQTLTLGCIASQCDQPIKITDVGHIRKHECDRLEALKDGLARLGIESILTHDTVEILPGKLKPALIDSHDDHRVAMSFAILGAVCPNISIDNPSCVAKTFPDFFEKLEILGFTIT